MKPHAMLPDKNHDEQSRQDFVASLRARLAARVMPGNTRIYESRLEPEFIEEHGRPPRDFREVKELMFNNGYYQFWSAMQRRGQEHVGFGECVSASSKRRSGLRTRRMTR